MNRRHLLCCGGAALGFFTSLSSELQAAPLRSADNPPSTKRAPLDSELQALLARCWQGLALDQLWDVHTHLLGNGDSGSGCRLSASMDQWWHPLEMLRKRVITSAACAQPGSQGGMDQAYVQRLLQLAADFPAGARWLLYAFDEALDEHGQARPDWTTFQTPDSYAAVTAQSQPERLGWVASIHPYRPDALERLSEAERRGAVAIKWLPSSMNIYLRDHRLRPFYDRLATLQWPLIVHCGEEHAVPGAQRQDLGNPLLLREPLAHGVRVIAAHCASLGQALDLDHARPRPRPAFELFGRLMDEADGRTRLLGDISAVFQFNRAAEVWHQLLRREDWHERLLHGSDYPLPAVRPLHQLGQLRRAGLLDERDSAALQRLRDFNPLLFDLALKRCVRSGGQRFSPRVFASARHFARPLS
ncbi:amidohydrolase family protein [Roseateles aquae]|nr:amidohydrolase family protein [Paucibacter sp. APW11]